MTSKLKKLVYKICGKKLPTPTEQRPDPQERNRRYREQLTSCGITISPDCIAKTPDGLNFRVQNDVVDCTDYPILKEIFYDGVYMVNTADDEKIVVVDIGMNVGIATLYFANKPNVTRVYSFEPFEPTYKRALDNISLNPGIAAKIETRNIGWGRENQTLEIPYNQDVSGDMSTTLSRLDFEEKYNSKDRSIEKVTICDSAEVLKPVISSSEGQRIILKIDTEGAEFDILESLDEANLLNYVDFIIMEYHFKSPQRLEDILVKNGFWVIYRDKYRGGPQVGTMYAARVRK